MRLRLVAVVLGASALACGGKGDKAGTAGDSGGASTDSGAGASTDSGTGGSTGTGFTVTGTAYDTVSGSPLDLSGLTVLIADPTAMDTSGGDPVFVATGTGHADGTFTVHDVVTISTLGLLVVVSGSGVLGSM